MHVVAYNQISARDWQDIEREQCSCCGMLSPTVSGDIQLRTLHSVVVLAS